MIAAIRSLTNQKYSLEQRNPQTDSSANSPITVESANSDEVVELLQNEVDPIVSVMKVEKAPLESYADFGGLDAPIRVIEEVVELPLARPESYEDICIKPPTGVIIYDDPRTRKALTDVLRLKSNTTEVESLMKEFDQTAATMKIHHPLTYDEAGIVVHNTSSAAGLMENGSISIKDDPDDGPYEEKVLVTYAQTLYDGGGWPLNILLSSYLKPLLGVPSFLPDSGVSMKLIFNDLGKCIPVVCENACENKLIEIAACFTLPPKKPPEVVITHAQRGAAKRRQQGQNVNVDFFGDTCRWMAPIIFSMVDGMVVVTKQPKSKVEQFSALLPFISCLKCSIQAKERALDMFTWIQFSWIDPNQITWTIVEGSVDITCNSELNASRRNWRACPFIPGTKGCECFSYSAFATNLFTYMTNNLHESNVSAARSVTTCAALKRAECVESHCLYAPSAQYEVFYLGLYMIALGTGGIKPCISSFGAFQLEDTVIKQRVKQDIAINMGAPVSSRLFTWNQDIAGWSLRFRIPALCRGVASSHKWIVHGPMDNSLLFEIPITFAIKRSKELEHINELATLAHAVVLSGMDYYHSALAYPMPKIGERLLAQELRGDDLSTNDMPEWTQVAYDSCKTIEVAMYFAGVEYPTECNQPCKVAAMSVAKEFGCHLGEELGYAIRFEDWIGPEIDIKHGTDGMPLIEILIDDNMSQYLVFMLDEAHERPIHTKILLGFLKTLLRIESFATLDAETFSWYFSSAAIVTVLHFGKTFLCS